jgi:uncharacterized protein (DUF433 family)
MRAAGRSLRGVAARGELGRQRSKPDWGRLSAGETIETIPIVAGTDGVIRVSGTRVTLDSILVAFNDGATPEEIAQQYPTVPLADIYHLIGYCLRHSAEMENTSASVYASRRKCNGRAKHAGGPTAFANVC